MNLENLNREALRNLCREAGIVYGKLTTTQMKEALAAKNKALFAAPARPILPKCLDGNKKVTFAEPEKGVDKASRIGHSAGLAGAATGDHNLPENTMKTPEQIAAEENAKAEAARESAERKANAAKQKEEAVARKAAGKAEAKAAADAAKAAKAETKAAEAAEKAAEKAAKLAAKEAEKASKPKREKLPEQNGVVRPGRGGKGICARCWDIFDETSAKLGRPAAVGDVKPLILAEDICWGNAVGEYYKWRKYNGVSGRIESAGSAEAKAAAEAAKLAKAAEKASKAAAKAAAGTAAE